MAMRLTTENVRKLEHEAIEELCLPEVTEDMAVRTLSYIDGIHTMAHLVIDAIMQLGGD